MPHVDIKYNSDKISGDDLAKTMHDVARLVGEHFAENPDYVSVEVVAQSKHTLNRKDVDVEVDSAPGDSNLRRDNTEALAKVLASYFVSWLSEMDMDGDVGAYVRVFGWAFYEYGINER